MVPSFFLGKAPASRGISPIRARSAQITPKLIHIRPQICVAERICSNRFRFVRLETRDTILVTERRKVREKSKT
jgi:hypothetical protein